MRHKKSIFAAIAAFAALTASAVLLAVIYARNKYLPYLLTALQLALPAAIGAILILFGRDIPLRGHTDAPFPDNCRRIKRALLRVGRAIRRFCQGAARIFNRIRTPAAALLIILSAGFTIAAFAVFRTRMTSVYSLDYLPPVLLAVLFVIYIAVEKWCAHVTPDGNEDAYSSAVLGNMRTALATGRISLALCAVASTLKLLGLYDLQKALTIVLTVIFGYEALFILLSLTVVLIRREFASSPDLSIPLPFTGGGSRDMSLLGYLEKNTGITMRSLWSLKLVKKLVPYTVLLAAMIFWACTGLVQIESNEEGAVYRFGRLRDETLKPGIHLTLPWPFDRVETYSTGSVNRMTVGYISSEDSDNIWTAGHGSSEYKLLLGGGNELVSINLRIEYSISDLHRYLMCSSSPESILRALAYEAVTAHTINTDLTSLLSVDRTEFANDFAADLGERMSSYDLGLRVVSVVLESIHPPVEIASVYQEIVGAGIRAEQYMLEAEAKAAVTRANAEKSRTTAVNSANAAKSTAIASARAEVAGFLASAGADSAYPASYRYNKYLDAVAKAYGGARLVIVGEGIDSSKIYFGSVSVNP